MRRPINSVNGTYRDPNRSYSAQDALNVIPMMAEKGGTRTLSKYVDAPGLKPFCRIGVNAGGEVGFTPAGAGRGMRVVDGKLFVVAGRNLWQITTAGVSINHGTIPGVARVSMAHNQRGQGNELAIDNGSSRYVFNTQTKELEKVTDESFPGSIKAFFIDGYLGYIDPQGRYWGHSDLSNALNYNAFDAYEAEGQPDRIVTGHVSNREVLIAGQDTIEPYVNSPSGSGEAPFVRATNTVIECGCSARDSFCNVGLYTVFLDQNRTVQVLNGYTPVPISTSVIDSALQSCTKQQIANAYAFSVEAEGFQIYYLTVPGKFTFGYDFKNKEWHRRSSTGLDWWAVTDVVQWNGKWYALDSRRGDILELRWRDYPFDVQEELVREWVTGIVHADQSPVFVHELELLFGCGGQEFTTVDFPEQPVGPSISGSPPGGTVGIAYTPFVFTTTPGDAPIARTVILSGSIPTGMSWNRGTATLSGTPTRGGLYSFTLRTIDENDLFADLEVEVPVATVSLALYTTVDVESESYQMTDGINWGGWTVEPLTDEHSFAVATETAFVTFGFVGSPSRKPLVGPFVASTGTAQSGVGGTRSGAVSRNTGTIILTQGGGTDATRSVDDGASFANCGFTGLNAIFNLPEIDRWIGVQGESMDAYKSDDDGVTTSLAFDIPASSSAMGMCSFGIDGVGFIGASTAFPYAAKLWRTDGTSLFVETLPTLAGESFLGVGGGYIGGVLRLVCWTNVGELLVRDPETEEWALATDQPDGLPASVCCNGSMLIMSVNKDNPTDNEGIEQTSVDGDGWTERLRSTIGNTESFTAVASLLEQTA